MKVPEDFDPVMAYPRINMPMYKGLNTLSSDYVLPGIEYIENNGVTLARRTAASSKHTLLA